MNTAVKLAYISTVAPLAKFAELDAVVLVRSIESDGQFLPAGAEGTVVAIWGGGAAYEVEFSEPVHALETIEVEDLIAAANHG